MSKRTREVWHCDVCGWEWLPDTSKVPERCPNRECRKRNWQIGEEGYVSIPKKMLAAAMECWNQWPDPDFSEGAMQACLRAALSVTNGSVSDMLYGEDEAYADETPASINRKLVEAFNRGALQVIETLDTPELREAYRSGPAITPGKLLHSESCKCLMCKPPNSTQSKS